MSKGENSLHKKIQLKVHEAQKFLVRNGYNQTTKDLLSDINMLST